MAILGDISVDVVPPFMLSFVHHEEEGALLEDGCARFKIGRIEIHCGGQLMETTEEKKIAWFLAIHSNGELEEQTILSEDGSRLKRVNLIIREPAATPDQGFAIVGSLSSLYSSLYLEMTLGGRWRVFSCAIT